MIPNRKVVGSNPAKDTTRTIFTIIGIYNNRCLYFWWNKVVKNLTLSLKSAQKILFYFSSYLKNIQSIFLQQKSL